MILSRNAPNQIDALLLPRETPFNRPHLAKMTGIRFIDQLQSEAVFNRRKFAKSPVEPGRSKPDEIGKRIAG